MGRRPAAGSTLTTTLTTFGIRLCAPAGLQQLLFLGCSFCFWDTFRTLRVHAGHSVHLHHGLPASRQRVVHVGWHRLGRREPQSAGERQGEQHRTATARLQLLTSSKRQPAEVLGLISPRRAASCHRAAALVGYLLHRNAANHQLSPQQPHYRRDL